MLAIYIYIYIYIYIEQKYCYKDVQEICVECIYVYEYTS